jgi:hypothetical protein
MLSFVLYALINKEFLVLDFTKKLEMQVSDEQQVFASLYQNSDITEAFDDANGLLAQYERYCHEKYRNAK